MARSSGLVKLLCSSALLLLCCFLLPGALAEERFYEFVVSVAALLSVAFKISIASRHTTVRVCESLALRDNFLALFACRSRRR